MKLRISEIAVIAIIIASIAVGVYFYPLMPEKIASHWNKQGIVNGYLDKFWGLFLMPLITIAILALMIAIPKIDPLKKNIEEFRKHFDVFIIILGMFLLYIHCLIILYNLGMQFNMLEFMAPFFGILIFYTGVLIKNARQNWTIGIRTPWTLSNKEVWDKTHALGGILFKISGILIVLGSFFPDIAIWLILVPILASAVISMVYSYAVFSRLESKKRKKRN